MAKCLTFLCTLSMMVAAVVSPITNPSPFAAEKHFMPSTGEADVLVIPVSFSDYSFDEDPVPFLETMFQGEGGEYAPSVHDYFLSSSYGQLTIQCTVTETVTLPYERSFYDDQPADLVQASLENAAELGYALTDFDADDNGYLDGLYLIFAGPPDQYGGFWWPNSDTFYDDFVVEGIHVGSFSLLSDQVLRENSSVRQLSAVHETGHQLGLTDYYREGAVSGTGGNMMMDLSSGDEDAFSKLMLDWIHPTVIRESGWYEMTSTTTSDSCLLIAPEGWDGNRLSEYFLVEYRTREGNMSAQDIGDEGALRILHVDAETSKFTNTVSVGMYRYHNDGTSSPQLLVLADKSRQWYEPGTTASPELSFYGEEDSHLLVYFDRVEEGSALVYVSLTGSMPGAEDDSGTSGEDSSELSSLPDESPSQAEDSSLESADNPDSAQQSEETNDSEKVDESQPAGPSTTESTLAEGEESSVFAGTSSRVSAGVGIAAVIVLCYFLLRNSRHHPRR